jgi:hypothetical protein
MIPANFTTDSSGGDDRSALFAQINQGADITKGEIFSETWSPY